MTSRPPNSLIATTIAALLVVLACGGSSPSPSPWASTAPSSAPAPSPSMTIESSPTMEVVRNPAAYVEGAPYAQVLDPADFVAVVDNPYFPLTPGTTYVFEGGTERIETAVTHDTRVILGITTVVVHDQVFDDGELIEDTFDWYAQDRWGDVWYLGEDTSELDGSVVTSKEGSWEAGVDGAQPGVVMLAGPRIGDVYRQEFYAGHAEDLARVVAIGGSAKVSAGSFEDVIVTEDWAPLEPTVVESKSYAPGVGFIQETFVTGGEGSIELVEIRTGG